jgi:hypothetical protein
MFLTLSGKRMFYVSAESDLEKEYHKEIDTGHVRLVVHPESLQTIQDFLKA